MDEPGNEPDEYDDWPRYKPASQIEPSTLHEALGMLTFLGDDLFLRMHAFNLDIVDPFLMVLEYQVL